MRSHHFVRFGAIVAAFLMGIMMSLQFGAVDAKAKEKAYKHKEAKECRVMAHDMHKMKAKKEKMCAWLDSQLQQMKDAEGPMKMEAMADVIETLVDQRKELMDMQEDMCKKMIKHMDDCAKKCPCPKCPHKDQKKAKACPSQECPYESKKKAKACPSPECPHKGEQKACPMTKKEGKKPGAKK